MITLKRTSSADPGYSALVVDLDAELAERDGDEHSWYAQFHGTEYPHVVLAMDGEQAIACGAIKEHASGAIEIKRMYTAPDSRGRGVASLVLCELERWATELSFSRAVLETGKRQPEAISLYRRNGYEQIPNYGQYEGVQNSVCFGKDL